ncbi:ribonuclease BN [Protofrankia symbiont of Coriaria ruscifolia]|uniref:Ribonuclease BN n=1 Tax=Candidatus Protofrankia californiensis TaxID=1839754 RepID=A0A1C3NWV8_9ACTN|nr:ribonuclease BN [Protofrankia symbiont of Coriaria ruscifolia]SBW21523.1 ribonuclease BN [Candidatus Protofrankia californiensis]
MPRSRRARGDGRTPRPSDGAGGAVDVRGAGGAAADRIRRLFGRMATAVRRVRARLRGSAAEDLASRLRQGDLINGAMNLAALILMMFFPFIIALAALSPLRSGGAAEVIIRRMGLSQEAAQAVERLFAPQDGTVRNGWSILGALWLILGGLSLATAVQSVYVRVFGLRPLGLRGVPAQVGWLCGLIVFLAGTTAAGALLTGTIPGQIGYGLLNTAGLLLFLWAGTRILTLGRLGWREVWPSAAFTTVGLTGLGVVSRLTFSASIVSNERNYGSIGVVFTILSWLIGFGVVLTGGAIVGMWRNETQKPATRTMTRTRAKRDSGRGGRNQNRES